MKKFERIQGILAIVVITFVIVSVPIIFRICKPVSNAYQSFRESLIVFDLDGWDNSLVGLIEGSNDTDFERTVNSYQERLNYLKKLELAEEPYYAESMALKEAMENELTIGRTYNAWGYIDPNVTAIIYLVILLFTLIVMVALRLMMEKAKEKEAKNK